MRYAKRIAFEAALKLGDLDRARLELDELAKLPETGALHMPECYADLAQSFDHQDARTTRPRRCSARSTTAGAAA